MVNSTNATEKRIAELEKENAELKNKLEFHELFNENSFTWEAFRDNEGRIIYLSPSFEKILGYNREDYISGKIKLSDFVHPDDKETALSNLQKQLDKQPLTNFICRCYNSNKSLKYISVSSVPVYNKHNEYIGFRTSVTDITELKKAELSLRESKEKYKALIESTQTGYLILDSKGCVVDANAEYISLTGRTSLEQIIGRKVTEWTASYDIERNACAVKECLKNGFIHNLQIDYISENGKVTPIEIHAKVVQLGSDYQIISVCRDITYRRIAEQALKESEKKYRLIAENASDVIWVFDIKTEKFEYFSPSVYNLLGYEVNEALEHDFDNDPNNPPSFVKLYENIKKQIADYAGGDITRKRICLEVLQPNKTGKLIWLEVELNIITDENNVPVKLLAINRNIDSRKNAEIQLQQYSDELKLLNKDKDRFISILAHDLRNPFNGIIGLLRTLMLNLHSYDKDEIEQLLETIYDSSVKAYKLLEEVLLWSNSQAGKLPFKPEKIKVSDVCKELIEDLKNQSAAKMITVNCSEMGKTEVYADPNMFKTIMRNLISNAVKFTKDNGKINIFAEKNEGYTTIKVIDDGVGMDETTKQNLWSGLMHYAKPGTDGEKGSGLGLILCKEFVEKHGGKIFVESEEDKGSTFYFTLDENLVQAEKK